MRLELVLPVGLEPTLEGFEAGHLTQLPNIE
jgi:hypothetical protein